MRRLDADADPHNGTILAACKRAVTAIFGPTAVGKTALAIALARRLRAVGEQPVAVSADALAVYRGLEILTGAPSAAQQRELEHRLVSFVPLERRFSVAEYARLAHTQIDALLHEGARPLVVGGTGLYLRAALTELALRPRAPEPVRQRWSEQLARVGAPALHAQLAERAPWAAARIDPNDSHRVVRALELDDIGALTPPTGASQLWSANVRHPTRLIGVVMERDQLYARIDARVDAMVDEQRRSRRCAARTPPALLRRPAARSASLKLLAGDVEKR